MLGVVFEDAAEALADERMVVDEHDTTVTQA